MAEFRGVATPLIGVKEGAGSGVEGEIDMITGATISSRAIVDIINHRLEDVDERVRTLWSGGLTPPAMAAEGVTAGGAPMPGGGS